MDSMAAKIVQNISYDNMSKNISDMLKFNIVHEETILSIVRFAIPHTNLLKTCDIQLIEIFGRRKV